MQQRLHLQSYFGFSGFCHAKRLNVSAIALAVLSTVATTQAATSTWITDANGNWSDTANWTGGVVADGSGFTANFTNDITAARTVTNDAARTITNINFSDNGASGSAWTIGGAVANTLTLAGPTPTITTATNATINVPIAGTAGLVKAGPGQLSIAGTQTFTGGITINGGILQVTGLGGAVNVPSQTVTMNGGAFIFNDAAGANNKTLTLGSLVIASGNNRVVVQRAAGLNASLQFGALARSAGAIVTYEARDAAGALATSPTNPLLNLNGPHIQNIVNQGAFILDANGVTDYAIPNASGANASMRTPTYVAQPGLAIAGAALVTADANPDFNNNMSNRVATSITGQATATVRTIKFGTASTVDLGLADNSTLKLTAAGLLRAEGGTTTISGNNATIATNSNVEYVFNAATAADSLTVNVPLTANGVNPFTKTGLGAVTLGGANGYTGNTFVNSGTLTLANSSQEQFVIGASGINNMMTGLGTLNLNGAFALDLSGATANLGDSWNLVNVASLNETFGASFNIPGFTETANVWSNGTYDFSEATGLLTVSNVPEPASIAVLAVIGGGLLARRRRI
ncbi:MAG: hypothetical protein JWM57_205 [Phycisphaerales bacterium]|nr:hypothetical protein [Phycisphaerales bacterium]